MLIAGGTAEFKGVILSGNTAPTGPECQGSLASQGYNLIESNADCSFTAAPTDIVGQSADLAPLADPSSKEASR